MPKASQIKCVLWNLATDPLVHGGNACFHFYSLQRRIAVERHSTTFICRYTSSIVRYRKANTVALQMSYVTLGWAIYGTKLDTPLPICVNTCTGGHVGRCCLFAYTSRTKPLSVFAIQRALIHMQSLEQT